MSRKKNIGRLALFVIVSVVLYVVYYLVFYVEANMIEALKRKRRSEVAANQLP